MSKPLHVWITLFILSNAKTKGDGFLSWYLFGKISLNNVSFEEEGNSSWWSLLEVVPPHGNILLEEKHKFDCFFGNSSSSKLLSFRCLEKLLLSNNSDDGCWLRIFVFSCQNISCAKDNCFSSSSSTSTSSSIFIFHFFGKLEVCLKKKEKQRKYEIITYQVYRSEIYISSKRDIDMAFVLGYICVNV